MGKGRDWSVLEKISLARLLLLFGLDEDNSGLSVFQKIEEEKQIPYSLSNRSILGLYKYLKNHRDTIEVLALDILNEEDIDEPGWFDYWEENNENEEDGDYELDEDSDKEKEECYNNEQEDASGNEKGYDTWVLNPYHQTKEDSSQLLQEEKDENEKSEANQVGEEENIEDKENQRVESKSITYDDHYTTGEEEEMPVTQNENFSQLIENIKEEALDILKEEDIDEPGWFDYREENSDNEQRDKEKEEENTNEKEDNSVNEKEIITWFLNPYHQVKEDSSQMLKNIREEEDDNEESGVDGVGEEENMEDAEDLRLESEKIMPVTQDENSRQLIDEDEDIEDEDEEGVGSEEMKDFEQGAAGEEERRPVNQEEEDEYEEVPGSEEMGDLLTIEGREIKEKDEDRKGCDDMVNNEDGNTMEDAKADAKVRYDYICIIAIN